MPPPQRAFAEFGYKMSAVLLQLQSQCMFTCHEGVFYTLPTTAA